VQECAAHLAAWPGGGHIQGRSTPGVETAAWHFNSPPATPADVVHSSPPPAAGAVGTAAHPCQLQQLWQPAAAPLATCAAAAPVQESKQCKEIIIYGAAAAVWT